MRLFIHSVNYLLFIGILYSPWVEIMPSPREDETQYEFVDRCMSDEEANDTFPGNEQRAAFCFSQWRESLNTNKCNCGKQIHFNAEVSGLPRIITHEGQEVITIPVVAIVEGVLNNYMVPKEEFGKFVNSWEGIPVPVSHPEVNGMFVSANLPEILEARNIGRFHKVSVEDNKLKGEIWVYSAMAGKKGFEALVNKLKSGEKIEVSTAYFADTENTKGTFNGKSYDGIHRNLRPDHLAILPDEIGACSIADGCGTFQNKEKGAVMSLWANIKTKLGLSDEYDDKEADVMALIKNESDGEKPEDMEAKAEEEQPESGKETEEVEDMAEEKPETNALDAETLTAVNWAKQEYTKKKDSLVAKLHANERCAFSEDELKAMHVDMLEKLSDSLNVDYSGRGMPITHSHEKEEPLETPLVVLAKEA